MRSERQQRPLDNATFAKTLLDYPRSRRGLGVRVAQTPPSTDGRARSPRASGQRLTSWRLDRFFRMSDRISALSMILRSPMRILGIVLMLVFTVEVAVMITLPYVVPRFLGETGRALYDALLLTLVCAPALWWVIIGPLRRIAIQEHQRSETIVANAGEGIVTFDHEGGVFSCNRAANSLFGLGADALIGHSIHALIPDLPADLDDSPGEFRLEAVDNRGGTFPVLVTVSEYPSESHPMRIAIIRDLTATQRAEQERLTMARETEALRAQQMATLAQLATGVAHEIRNPLTSIKMLIQVNRTKFAEEGLPTDDLELVEQEIRRMERSVNSLLDYARPEESEFAEFSILQTIRRSLQLVESRCKSQGVTIEFETTESDLRITGDSQNIGQLLLNLFLNALDAMPEGGTLRIAVEPIDDRVRISVGDTGTGICETMMDRLFTPFATTKPNGVGLGLGICRRIAEAHGGTLVGRNQSLRGAEFTLNLPRLASSANDSQSSDSPCKAC